MRGPLAPSCEGRGITRIEDVQPVHVAGYIEQLQATHKATTVKQHLACIRMLFDCKRLSNRTLFTRQR